MPTRSSHPGSGRASLLLPYRCCSGSSLQRWTVSSHRVSSYLTFPPLPSSMQTSHPSPCRQRQSSSVPLRLLFLSEPLRWVPPGEKGRGFVENMELASTTAVYLCCTFPEVAFGGRYPLSLPCGARTFLTTGLSTWPRDRLSYSRSSFYRKGRGLSTDAARQSLAFAEKCAILSLYDFSIGGNQ